jgi:diaminohydroxyphosphoribosylaminopyrimidine deaminase/5-amino-6-(5-phosphoribosylamino)uracil reductase
MKRREQHERFMAMALALAKRGAGKVSPNPMVGAVVVSPDGEVLAKGYHRRYGGLHAEREALKRLNWRAEGATVYVNLEPCCHYGKTPPCTEALIEAGVSKVVVGMVDPNSLVAGKGISILRQAGVEVVLGVLEDECRHLNRTFIHFITTGTPWVLVKWAQSLDGRIATSSGDSRWISCESSLKFAHRLRAEADAVLVGRETVEMDDCQLTVRLVKGKNPLRVVLDSRLTLSPEKRVFSADARTLIYTLSEEKKRISDFQQRGVEVISLQGEKRVPLPLVLKDLGKRGVASLLVEGGGEVITSFLRLGLANEVAVVVAPLILGKGREAVRDLGIEKMCQGLRLTRFERRRLGVDTLFRGVIKRD